MIPVAAERLAHASGLSIADLALLLLLAGILLIYAEFNRPGTILLGASGALLFMLGVLLLLPLAVSPPAAAVAALGLALLLSSLRFPLRSWHSLIAIAGTAAIAIALRFLVRQPAPVHWAVAIFTGVLFAAVTCALGRIALLARRNKRLPATPSAARTLAPRHQAAHLDSSGKAHTTR